MPEEFDDLDADRHFDLPLREPHQQVFDLGGLGLRRLGGDAAQGDEVLLATVAENETLAAVSLLEAGHGRLQCHPNVVASLFPVAGVIRRRVATSIAGDRT